jgi:hypothetical protein
MNFDLRTEVETALHFAEAYLRVIFGLQELTAHRRAPSTRASASAPASGMGYPVSTVVIDRRPVSLAFF